MWYLLLYFHQEKLESSFLLDKLWSLCFNFKCVQCDIHLFTKNDLKAHVVICQTVNCCDEKHLSKLASVHLILPSKPFYLPCWVSPHVVFTSMWLQPCLGHMILKTEEEKWFLVESVLLILMDKYCRLFGRVFLWGNKGMRSTTGEIYNGWQSIQ